MRYLKPEGAAGRSWLVLLTLAALGAAEPVKPPWQRLLQGNNAEKAAEQEKQLERLQDAGKFADALKIAEALAERRAKVQGADHWQAVNARWEVQTIRRILRQGKEEQTTYVSCFALEHQADTLVAKGRYREAQPLLEKSLAIRIKILGEDHPDTATLYNNVAFNLDAQGKSKAAEKGLLKALVIRRKTLGEDHPETANSYNNVAYNLYAQGRYPEAEKGFLKALAICRKVLGENHRDTALGYNNVAVSLGAQGKHEEAGEGRRKALAIYRKVLGEEHPLTATSYNNIASGSWVQGKNQEAEEGFRKVLAIRRKVLGEDHPQTATSYFNLAASLDAQGKYRQAEELVREALAIDLKRLGEDHPDTASSYSNLAANLLAQGKQPEAEELFRRVLAIRRKRLGEEHPDTASSYHNLASLLRAQGKYLESEEHSRKALAVMRKVLGEEHASTASSYNSLAADLEAQGKFTEAEEIIRKALTICRKRLGEGHLNTVLSYANLAGNLYHQGKYTEAEKYGLQAVEAFDKARLHIAASGLERAAITSKRSPFPALAAVLARNGKPADAWQRFEESLARGTWDDLSARLRRPQTERTKQDQLSARRNRLDQLIARAFAVKEPTPEQSAQRQTLLTQQRQAQEELAAFSRRLEDSYGPVAGKVFSRANIQAALPVDAALIGWLDLPGQRQAADPNGEHWAVLFRSAGPPVWMRLPGTGTQHAWIAADSRLPAQLRAALQSPSSDWQTLADRLRQQRLVPLAQHLKGVRRLIVLPSTALAGLPVEVIASEFTVSYAHSGTMHAYLHQQPASTGKGLFALADPVFEMPTLADKPQPLPPGGVLLTVVQPGSNAHQAGLKVNDVLLRYGDKDLASPADFKLQPESRDSTQRVPVLVWRQGKTLSRPLYLRPGKLGAVIAKTPAPQAVAQQRRWDRWLVSRSSDGVQWQPLPGTRVEVAALRRLFATDEPAELLLDSAAGEAPLYERAQSGALGRYQYLHLATHGQVDDVFPLRSAVILSRDHLPDDKQRQELLMAGQPIPDGRLTAEEVLRQWHLHCDLVTLSACQTALGKYERGEGFVGFAQALILAGSRSVCLSLWKVNDAATALLMERFYQNLLGRRDGLKAPLPKAAALAEAKNWLRKLPRAEALKRAASLSEGVERGLRSKPPRLDVPPASAPAADADHPYAHPYYWAAFVLIGDPQ